MTALLSGRAVGQGRNLVLANMATEPPNQAFEMWIKPAATLYVRESWDPKVLMRPAAFVCEPFHCRRAR